MSEHRRGHGWYSFSVLARVLQNCVPPEVRLLDGPAHVSAWDALTARDDVVGALVNISNRHWTCMCKESGGVFYVDSMWSPHLIEQQDWVRILERHPDTRLVLAADSSWDDS